MFKLIVAAIKAAFRQWQINRLDAVIRASTAARAKAKEKALKAQAKRDALIAELK